MKRRIARILRRVNRKPRTITGIKRTIRDLEGSILGDVLKEHPDIQVAPLLGVNYVKPWRVARHKDA